MEVAFDLVELRDSDERPIARRRSKSIPLAVAHGTSVEERLVVVPPHGSVRGEAFRADVRRLRVSGSVRAYRRWRGYTTTRFDFDMDQDESFRGAMHPAAKGERLGWRRH